MIETNDAIFYVLLVKVMLQVAFPCLILLISCIILFIFYFSL